LSRKKAESGFGVREESVHQSFVKCFRRQELSGFEENDDHGRLLDELASKQDHLARK